MRYTREVAGCPSICKELPVADFLNTWQVLRVCLLFFRKEQVFYIIMNAELDKIKSGSSAVILCGGKSTRMGQDKAGLLIEKKTFLQQIEENLKDADEILLSVKDRRDYPVMTRSG